MGHAVTMYKERLFGGSRVLLLAASEASLVEGSDAPVRLKKVERCKQEMP